MEFFVWLKVIGTTLFGTVGCGFQNINETAEEEAAQCAEDMDKANFSTFDSSMNLLYRVSTGD